MAKAADMGDVGHRYYSLDEARNAFMRHVHERYPKCFADLCSTGAPAGAML